MRTLLLILAALLTAPIAAEADSLFPSSGAVAASAGQPILLFSDAVARHVGDTLAIIITESATASSVAATKTSKTDSSSFGPGTGPLLSVIKALGLTGSTSSDASGSTNRVDSLSARVMVTVKQILPNGNLVVQGDRKVGMNAEMQTITLTGVVRPQDIASDNTIQSPLVADAQIQFSGKGPVGDKQHEGIISRIFKFLF